MPTTRTIRDIPRLPLVKVTTALYRLERLSELYRFPIYVKRDDLTGVGAGGNKARKLEYLLADARSQGAASVISGGALQSNHAAMTAVCARYTGFDCHLALVDAVPIESLHYQHGGNLVLDHLCGAKVTRFPAGSSSNDCINRQAELVREQTGTSPYIIPVGGSSATGALGYVRAGLEIADQLQNSNAIVDTLALGSGSAGTQAGLVVGLYLAGLRTNVLGISVLSPAAELRKQVVTVCQELSTMLDITGIDWSSRVWVNDGYVGPGYGLPYDKVWDALGTAIQNEGLLLDPVYTGKGFAGLLDYLDNRRQELGSGVLFLHTGGLVGALSYAAEIYNLTTTNQ